MTRTEHVFFLSSVLTSVLFMPFASHSFSFCPVPFLHLLSLCTHGSDSVLCGVVAAAAAAVGVVAESHSDSISLYILLEFSHLTIYSLLSGSSASKNGMCCVRTFLKF